MDAIKTVVYKICRFLVWLFYPKIKVEGLENLPDEPCIIVGNHSQLHGPVACELYFPGDRAIWCNGEMMHLKEVPAYAFEDFWHNKPWWNKWFFHLLSYIIAPISVCIFTKAHTIGVYRDKRIISTFRDSLNKLKSGGNLIIFPEHYVHYNSVLSDFQDGFVDIAKTYYKQTGKCVKFVPLYIAPRLHSMHLGAPVSYEPDNSPKQERERVCTYLKEQISAIAYSLPKHIVVPYENVGRKNYGYNIQEGEAYEEARC